MRDQTNNSISKSRRSMTVGIVAAILVVTFVACSQKRPVSFADSLVGIDSERAISLSESYIDSLATNNPAILATEIRSIVESLQARGYHNAALQVAAYPYGVDANEQPRIAERLLYSTLLPGKPAPPIIGNNGQPLPPGSYGKKTILFFYDSRCRNCQQIINQMIDRYSELTAAGIRIITLSSDRERDLFDDYSRKFPWSDKLCDFASFESPNYIAYGVASTPTLYLLEDGKVIDQFGTLGEILQYPVNP